MQTGKQLNMERITSFLNSYADYHRLHIRTPLRYEIFKYEDVSSYLQEVHPGNYCRLYFEFVDLIDNVHGYTRFIEILIGRHMHTRDLVILTNDDCPSLVQELSLFLQGYM